jgi:hypothetical protein
MTGKRQLERVLEKELQKTVVPQVQDQMRARIAETLNDMVAEYEGRPVDEVKPAVVSRLAGIGVKISDPQLTQYAEEIAAGGSFTIRT